MKPITAVLASGPGGLPEKTLFLLERSPLVEAVFHVCPGSVRPRGKKVGVLQAAALFSGEALNRVLDKTRTDYLLLFPGFADISPEPGGLEGLVGAAQTSGAGIVYADFYETGPGERTFHPLNDYQPGSVRDDFDFGPLILLSAARAREALDRHGPVPDVQSAGLYDLRLKISIGHPLHHLREPLYTVAGTGEPEGDEKRFAYLNPRHESAQKEMEAVFTDYLKRIGAYLPPGFFRELPPETDSYPAEVSVVIPVRNREQTIAEAVKSALSQETDFPFNVLAVDNHSTDRTSPILSGLAARHPALKHIIPERTDLGIGGCWNVALRNKACGRFAVQLDSDDLYSGPHTLKKMADGLRQGGYALVIGSYTLVDSKGAVLPPGLVDHREWTDENGRNNALRINGLGAPRGFRTGLMRRFGFRDVSYGEDYAAALRLCREFRIGRIFESLYLCRRWPGNTDAGLSPEAANRNDAFKDGVRTEEIEARRRMNRER
jgi:hypothetical protein